MSAAGSAIISSADNTDNRSHIGFADFFKNEFHEARRLKAHVFHRLATLMYYTGILRVTSTLHSI